MRHYVLIDPEALTVQTYELIDGRWLIIDRDGDTFDLAALDVTIPLTDLFDGLGDPLPAVDHPARTLPAD